MFLKKLRTRRSDNTAGDSKTPRKSKGGIFSRRKAVAKSIEDDESPPEISPALTMETDDDEDEEISVLSMAESLMMHSISPDEVQEPTVTFTERQVMTNTLQHMRELSAKEREVFKMKSVLEELKSIHWAEIKEKDQEIAECRIEFETKLNEKDGELCGVKKELVETKEGLKQVSSVLIECQHKLHDARTVARGTWQW